MIKKKTEKSNLENKRAIFLQLGLVITMASAIMVLEYATADSRMSDMALYNYTDEIPEEIIETIRTYPKEKTPPPPVVIPKLIIVDNEAEIEDPDFDFSTDAEIDDLFKYLPVFEEEKEVTDDTFFVVEDMPRFKNGDLKKFSAWIQKKLNYPELAAEIGVQGKVFVQFIIDKNGKVTDAQIIKSVDPLLDEEVLRVVNSAPQWEPGRQRGMPVKVAMTLPVYFRLQ